MIAKAFSLADLGLRPGDYIIIDKSLKPEHGDVVLASFNGGFTLKQLYRRNGSIALYSRNKARQAEFPTFRFSGEEELVIVGVMTGSFRKGRRGAEAE